MADAAEAWGLLRSIPEELERRTRERPYPVLAFAMMVGYGAGGGLFSRWTRPLARAAMGALLVPAFRERLREATRAAGGGEVTGAA
jgi:hypothetical protein